MIKHKTMHTLMILTYTYKFEACSSTRLNGTCTASDHAHLHAYIHIHTKFEVCSNTRSKGTCTASDHAYLHAYIHIHLMSCCVSDYPRCPYTLDEDSFAYPCTISPGQVGQTGGQSYKQRRREETAGNWDFIQSLSLSTNYQLVELLQQCEASWGLLCGKQT